MKRTLLLLFTAIVITSCSSSSRVCGGSGGKRCVEATPKINIDKAS